MVACIMSVCAPFIVVLDSFFVWANKKKVEDVKEALNRAREAGIQNILALRGDPSKGELSNGHA